LRFDSGQRATPRLDVSHRRGIAHEKFARAVAFRAARCPIRGNLSLFSHKLALFARRRAIVICLHFKRDYYSFIQ
jgi:hypothetical protein